MQVPGLFEYERATDVENAIALLDRLGDEARIVAGGHSLLPMMKLRLANPEYLIDINDLAAELGDITVEADAVRIGAMVRHRQILESDDLARLLPIFRDAERVIADPVVRNRGTIGGSLCQADPAEDLTTVCTVVGAVCVIRGPTGVREVPMEEFLVGPYETAVRGNEILTEVWIPRCRRDRVRTRRSNGGWGTGRSRPPAPRSGWTVTASRRRGSVSPRWCPTPSVWPTSGTSCAGNRPTRRTSGGRANWPGRPANPSRIRAAPPPTSGISPRN